MKKYWKTWLCLLLACMMLISVVGCDNDKKDPDKNKPKETKEEQQDKDTEETTPEEEETTEGEEKAFEDLTLVSNGTTEYTIWIQNAIFSNEDVQKYTEDITEGVKKKTGAVLTVKSDSQAMPADADKPAILIGKTNFAESKQMSGMSRNKDYAITGIGNKIMIYFENADAAVSAIRYFYNKVIVGQKIENNTIFFTEAQQYFSQQKYGIESAVFDGKELKEYRIVLPKNATVNEKTFAFELSDYLQSEYGYSLEMTTDESAAKYEILVGNTSRTKLTSTQQIGYTVSVASGKIKLLATDMFGYQGLCDYIKDTFLKSGSSLTYTYENGFSYSGTAKLKVNDGTRLAASSFGDVRIMLYNVYGYTTTCGGPGVRQPYQIELIKSYMPDVVGFQEYSNSYHSGFTSRLTGLGYKRVDGSTATNVYTPLFYLPEKLQVLESGFLRYTGPNDGGSKGVEWAVFKDKETGKAFMVLNTHFMWSDPSLGVSEANAARVSNAKELLGIISTIQAKQEYANIPILMGGDLNSNTASDPHTALKQGGLTSAWDVAATKNDSSGHHGYSTYDADLGRFTIAPEISGNYSKSIDHMYVNDKTEVVIFVSLSDNYSLWTSDHMPMIAEITLS